MEHLRCVVERITYHDEKSGFTVLRCAAKGFGDLVTVVGTMPEIHVGSVLSLDGAWRVDPKYGKQFAAQHWEETLPATVYGIEKYLGSGLVRGIGPKFAKRIVQVFGKDTLEVIEQHPEALSRVPGIGKHRLEEIRRSWAAQKEIKNLMVFLQGHDVSTSHATKIYKTYGNDSIRIVRENPYRLADDIWGIGFKTADGIAQKLGFGRDRFERLRSGLLYTLNRLADEGHCYATREQLLKAGAALLEAEEPRLAETLEVMLRQEDVITDHGAVYLPPFYHAETGAARRLRTLRDSAPGIHPDPAGLDARVRRLTNMEYDSVQRAAIETAVRSKLLILTGGPGTGKTTTTRGILAAFQDAGAKILLAAPTGRAAKRLSEATGMEAKTIHRLLEFKPPEGYQKHEHSPLEGDLLIVDECSMIDLMLLYHLLKAVPASMRLILVGDVDQLPSVGAGNVLRDLIESNCFPVVRLTRIFRQAQSSRIVMNAHSINAGRFPDISNGLDTDFFFLPRETPEEALATILELVKTRLPRKYGVRPGEIQVLTPMQRGVAGAANLNQALQAAVNPGTQGVQRGGMNLRAADKVMQLRNNYDKEVFNGDIGVVDSIDPEERRVTVRVDGRAVDYDYTELDELTLAYATTIHKAQGSEYPIVVVPLLMSHFVMLQRNLLYTAVTRAKRLLVLVGTKKALAFCVRNVTVSDRNTMLRQRLEQAEEGM